MKMTTTAYKARTKAATTICASICASICAAVLLLPCGFGAAVAARAQEDNGASKQDGGANKYAVAGFERAEDAENFLRELQRAVAANERARVAAMFDFPVKVNAGRRKLTLRRRADLLRRYDAVFNRNVRRALASQRASELFANWQGVMIGSGQIWFRPDDDGRPRVVAVNTDAP